MVGVDEDDGKDVGWDATPCSANAPMSEVGVGSKASVGVGSGATPCSADSPGVGVGSAGDIGAPSGVVGAAAMAANGAKIAGAQMEVLGPKDCKPVIYLPETTPTNIQTEFHFSLLTKCFVKISAAITSDIQSCRSTSGPMTLSWSHATETQWVRWICLSVGARPVVIIRAVAWLSW